MDLQPEDTCGEACAWSLPLDTKTEPGRKLPVGKEPAGKGKEDATFTLARYIVNTRYEDLPPDVVETAKRCILDTLGVTIGASGLGEGCQKIIDLVRDAGGKEEATILGFGTRVPVLMAAFANGSMTHELDYDDCVDEAYVHPTAPNLPAAMAIAELKGNVSGKDFITAIALGGELITRMGLAVTSTPEGYVFGWFLTPLFGCFSAAAVAGKLFGLDEDKMADTLGHALQQAAGTRLMSVGTGAMTRSIYNGFTAKAGVLSALMAQKGITGTKEALESSHGLFPVYFGGAYDRAKLLDDLGTKFESTYVSLKPWPTGRCAHPHLNATLDIVTEHKINPDDIMEVVAYHGDRCNNFEPIELRRRPKLVSDAKLAGPFLMGVIAHRKQIVISDFTPERLNDRAALKFAEKVTAVSDDSLVARGFQPGIVEMKMRDGTVYSKRIEQSYGHPTNPLPEQHLIQKFKDCVSYSAKPVPEKNINRAIELLTGLEDVPNISSIVKLFS